MGEPSSQRVATQARGRPQIHMLQSAPSSRRRPLPGGLDLRTLRK
jgi:hypothetical protein